MHYRHFICVFNIHFLLYKILNYLSTRFYGVLNESLIQYSQSSYITHIAENFYCLIYNSFNLDTTCLKYYMLYKLFNYINYLIIFQPDLWCFELITYPL